MLRFALLAEIRTPVGQVETIRQGADITLVTYGSTCRIVMEAAGELAKVGIDCEVIDVQSLLPFDLNGDIVQSLQKTNRILFIDEDVPGGTTAYMLQEVIENQGGYFHCDSQPQTLSAKAHRPPYGTDGDYFSKPSADDVFDKVYEMMREAKPAQFPAIYE